MDGIKKLSLIIPAYNQEKTIVKNIKKLDDTLAELSINYEIIVVVDGMDDNTYQRAKTVKRKRVKVVGYPQNFGKGYAVRYGAMKGTGDIIGFMDAGMDIDPNGISMLLNHMIWYNAHVIVGSKLHPVSQVKYPFYRKVLSWGYRTLTRILFGFKIRDTQVGIKLFRKKVVRDVFPRLLVKQFAFDIEILAVAYLLGYKRIYEAPVKLKFNQKSSITSANFWNVIFFMLWDTLAVFYRLRIRRYYSKRRLRKVKNSQVYSL